MSLSSFFSSPMLATLVDTPFDEEGWVFEIKWDGYRAITFKDKKNVQVLSRGNKSFNEKFPSILTELKKISGDFILDGEIVLLDEKGRSRFQLLQNYPKRKEATPFYYVFDILKFKGKDLREMPLVARKKILEELLKSCKLNFIKYSDHVEKKGKALFKVAKKNGLEGIIAKKADSTYQSSRSRDWLKIKTKLRQEVVIGGFTEGRGGRKNFGALLVGVYKNKKLVYVGHVGGGFDAKLLSEVYAQLKKIISPKCYFSKEPHPNTPVTWVKPLLVCEVAFAEWTDENNMRQPIFQGMREDKDSKKVVKE